MKKSYLFDSAYLEKVHDRWIEKLDASIHASSGKPKDDQCYSCKYYFPICGKLADDWSVCTNGQASMDGRVVFEHAGCAHHDEAEKLWFDALREDDYKRFKKIQASETRKRGGQ